MKSTSDKGIKAPPGWPSFFHIRWKPNYIKIDTLEAKTSSVKIFVGKFPHFLPTKILT